MQRAMIILLICSWVFLSTAFSSGKTTTTEIDSFLLIDTRIPVFVEGRWRIMSEEETISGDLYRRGGGGGGGGSGGSGGREDDEKDEPTSTKDDTPTESASPLPSPFDGALAANFSNDQTCPNFINAFLSDPTFKSCYPVSLLLQGSRSFFEAQKSFFQITRTLDAACTSNVTSCTAYFDALASRLLDPSTCGSEYEKGNALVVDAYRGMRTYPTVYHATCLLNKDVSPPTYCFASAVTNRSTASNAYLYYLPLNHTLPDTSAPACGYCTRKTMEFYQDATANRKAEIVYSYPGAASQINAECGPDFVGTELAVTADSGAAAALSGSNSAVLLLSFLFAVLARWII
ncbi:hypothetical protein GGS20DRAFT_353176 [Poronia punctata]|nr:hypothetical protein GGS20DRAFT_353176 [Poronia punctata]